MVRNINIPTYESWSSTNSSKQSARVSIPQAAKAAARPAEKDFIRIIFHFLHVYPGNRDMLFLHGRKPEKYCQFSYTLYDITAGMKSQHFMLKIAKNGNMIRAAICRFCQGRYAIFFLCFFLLLNSVLQSILRHRSALQISASRASL